jgi:Ethanolamine utilization protein EutJ (predicted chaperonin)
MGMIIERNDKEYDLDEIMDEISAISDYYETKMKEFSNTVNFFGMELMCELDIIDAMDALYELYKRKVLDVGGHDCGIKIK